MARQARHTAQISALIQPDHRDELDRIADQHAISFGDALREVIEVGLPAVTNKYPPRLTDEELAELERQRAARRG